LFITLQHCVDAVRIGNAVDIMGEEISSDVQSDDVYTPSAYPINEVEPQVSPYDVIMLVG
jgi:hypothetical protein